MYDEDEYLIDTDEPINAMRARMVAQESLFALIIKSIKQAASNGFTTTEFRCLCDKDMQAFAIEQLKGLGFTVNTQFNNEYITIKW